MNYGLAFDEKRGFKKIWIRKNINKNKKYGLAFDEKHGYGKNMDQLSKKNVGVKKQGSG